LSSPAPVKAVIFDLGHTVWDFAPREDAWKLNILRLYDRLSSWGNGNIPEPKRLGKAVANAVERWMQIWNTNVLEQPPSSVLVTEALAGVDLAPPEDLVDELTALLFGLELDMPVISPDSVAAFDALDSVGLSMACVSNTITLEDGINDALMRLGMHRYFRSVVASSAMGYKKPHASLFERALAEIDVEPEHALFVGDRLVDDVSGAQAVGMRAVLTHEFRQEDAEASDITPDAVVQRLAELPAVIEALERGASYP
jgi:FMN phosphatase YigB (HAD superfamily)